MGGLGANSSALRGLRPEQRIMYILHLVAHSYTILANHHNYKSHSYAGYGPGHGPGSPPPRRPIGWPGRRRRRRHTGGGRASAGARGGRCESCDDM